MFKFLLYLGWYDIDLKKIQFEHIKEDRNHIVESLCNNQKPNWSDMSHRRLTYENKCDDALIKYYVEYHTKEGRNLVPSLKIFHDDIENIEEWCNNNVDDLKDLKSLMESGESIL